MRIYLAGRYSRRLELCGYREQIIALGHSVHAQWLDGDHQISDEGVPIGEHGESLVEGTVCAAECGGLDQHGVASGQCLLPKGHGGGHSSKTTNWHVGREKDFSNRANDLRLRFAMDDFRDVTMCELCICFTEAPRSKPGRGGRHVEMGIALGQMKQVWICGPRENIFCWLDDVRHFDNWASCLGTFPLANHKGKYTATAELRQEFQRTNGNAKLLIFNESPSGETSARLSEEYVEWLELRLGAQMTEPSKERHE